MKKIYEYQEITDEDFKEHIIATPSLHRYFKFEWSRLKAQNYCGILHFNGQDYYILPKITHDETQNLSTFIYMLIYAYDIKLSNEDIASCANESHSIIEVFVQLFAKGLLEELKKGIYKEYEILQDNLSTLRGKYLVDENIKHNFTHHKIYCEYDEFSPNNTLNQFLLYAIKYLQRFVHDKKHLKQCEVILDEVEENTIDIKRLNIAFNRLNHRYKLSYELALLLLRQSIPLFSPHQKSFAFLFDMNRLFEAFIARLIKELDSSTKIQNQKILNDLTLKPDIITSKLIIDTKYKKLVALIEGGDFNEREIFDFIVNSKDDEIEEGSIESLYKDIKDEKRIEFVTFHQSYSYEDFIEGFRPNEDGQIELEDGIFKLICNKAKNQVKEIKQHYISFDEAFDILRTLYVDDELEQLYTVSKIAIAIHSFSDKSIKVQSSKAKDAHYVKKSDLETVVQAMLNDEVSKPSDIRNLDVKKDTISLGTFYYPIGKKVVEIINQNSKNIEEKEKNYYIVIDEINRGNISKIFGELITLIEEDKRDSYEVTLPYSKTKFSIPSNLYIIATMNSSDKSIATMDIALRRRFTFIKMQPNPNLVENEKARALMEKLNEYIIEKRGEEYQLGHSYFMGEDIDLEFIKEYKIKPLLEEYFYGDDEGYKKAIDICRCI